ncbi:hypothetical protein [Saccharopolyspora pogona]|uniref:hypothetical protein n=1 Tax=Saccharopolyspora pogona TaxID=333966 RepID=UPI0016845E76|nr:hypothetical protein [Saccharopolyspora pogona]
MSANLRAASDVIKVASADGAASITRPSLIHVETLSGHRKPLLQATFRLVGCEYAGAVGAGIPDSLVTGNALAMAG